MAVPERRVTNREIGELVGVDESWITKRTGTRERPWASPGEGLTEFAARAAREALERAQVDPAALDLVMVATSTAEQVVPNVAPLLAGAIGAHQAGALDIGSACTGFLSGVALACGQIESGRARHVLVVGADFLSGYLDLSDRMTAPLFADGAGAALLCATADASYGIGPVVLHADSAGAELIALDRSGRISMQGPETFRAAVTALSDVTGEALRAAGVELGDIDLFVYHQANSRIIRAVGQRLRLPTEKVVDYVDRFANSSSATLPIALSVAEREGRLHPGDRMLLAAFGGGFTWAGTVMVWGGG